MIIDSHAHYAYRTFEGTCRFLDAPDGGYTVREGSRRDILEEMKKRGVAAWIEPAISLGSNKTVLKLCNAYPGRAFPAVGVHPTRVNELSRRDVPVLCTYAADARLVAIGETGLDFHRPRKEQHRAKQLYWFIIQIRLADRLRKPLVLHIREAYGPATLLLRLHSPLLHGGVAHCFCGTAKEAAALVKLGFHIGIGGALLKDNDTAKALADAVKIIPTDRILIETDAPFVRPDFNAGLTKKQQRKVCNTSLLLPVVIRRIAEIKGLDEETVEKAVYENTVKLFHLPQVPSAGA